MIGVTEGVANCRNLKTDFENAQRSVLLCNDEKKNSDHSGYGYGEGGRIECSRVKSEERNNARAAWNNANCPGAYGGKRKSKRSNKKRRSSRRKSLKSRRRR